MESSERTDRMLHANVEAFEAALAAGRARLDRPEWPRAALLVLDGSEQDATGRAVIQALGPRVEKLTVTVGAIDDDEGVLGEHASALVESGIDCDAVVHGARESHERILAVLQSCGAGLCILPSPFHHDLGELAQTTLGTVVEVVLERAPCPTLITRGPIESGNVLRPHLILADPSPGSASATRHALGLLANGDALAGTLAVTFVYGGRPDPDVDEAFETGWAISADALGPLLSKGLSGFLHKLGEIRAKHESLDLEVRLVPRDGNVIDDRAARLHVLAIGEAAHGVSELVHEAVLSTLDPLLVIGTLAGKESTGGGADKSD